MQVYRSLGIVPPSLACGTHHVLHSAYKIPSIVTLREEWDNALIGRRIQMVDPQWNF